MLGEALSYPRSGDDWLKTILIGGVLSLIGGFIFVTLLPVQGFMVRVLRSGAERDHEPPVFDQWGDLFVDGIKVIVIQIAYLVVPMIVLLFGLFVSGIGVLSAAEGATGAAGIGAVGALLLLVGGLLVVLVAYLVPAALANFAHEDSFGAAFDVGTVVDAAFTTDYLVALVLAFLVSLVLGGIALVLSFLIVGVFLSFYVQMSVFYLFGRGYAMGLDLESGGAGEGNATAGA